MIRQRNYPHIAAISGLFFGILLLGSLDTARAQTVTLSGTNGTTLAANNTLNVTVQQGGISTQQQVMITTNESGQPVESSVTVQVNQNAPWLQVAQAPQGIATLNTPVTLLITVNATNLKQGTQPSGTVLISPTGSPQNAVTLTVNVTVSGTSLLSSNPPSLTFTTTVGTTEVNVPTQQLTISSSAQQLSYTVSASTQNGLPWLIPSPATGTTGSSATDVITVGVNPAGLSVNTYQGTITVQSTTTQDAVVIAVTLVVAANTTLSVTPTTLQPFLYQLGTTPAPGQLTQTLQVSSNNSSVDFTVSVSPVVSWLVVSPTSSATGTNGQAVGITLTASPTGLSSGDYKTAVTITIVGGASLSPIPVELVVSTNPLLSLSATTLGFTSPFGATTPPPSDAVQVTTQGNSSTAVSFTVSTDQPWLVVTESSLVTPSTLTVGVNPSSLAVGQYTGHVTVTPNNSDANLYSLQITVTLTVGNTATVTAGPPLAIFAWETSQPGPQPEVIELFTTGQPVAFNLSPSVTASAACPQGWLSAISTSATTQNATITISANVTGMSPGVCPGTVTVSYPANSLSPQTLAIPVIMNVSNSALLNISLPLGFGDVSAAQGASQITQQISLTSTDPSTQITDISTSSTSNGPAQWLFFGQNGTSTPQTPEVIYNPGSLPPNTYAGTISIMSSKLPSSPVMIPVTLSITSSITVTASPTTLSFQQPLGGPLPSAQNVTLTSSASGATFQTSIPTAQACSWLSVTPSSGPATGPVAFSVVQNSLPQNTYQCPVTFSFLDSATAPITVTATLTVTAAQTLTVSPTSLTFAYQISGSAPATQQLTVTSTGGSVAFTAAANSTGGWLGIDTTTSATGTSGSKVINVSVNPADFPAGTTGGSQLTGTITITSAILSAPITVNVTLNVTAAPVPTPTTIVNSAISNGFGAVAPGELIAIKGTNLGPACSGSASCVSNGYVFTVNSNGTVSSTLQGVSVSFNGTAGTPTFVSPAQINVIVPWEVAGFSSVQMIVTYNTVQSAAFSLQVTPVAPGIFTQNATGAGQAAAENVNTSLGSALNGPAGGTYFGTSQPTAPAPQGSTVVMYLTGGGLTNPVGVDGTLNSSTTLMPLKNWTPGSSTVTATIGGAPATVEFAGAVPTLITGVVQVNLQVPTGVTGSALPVVITIDGQTTQTNATIAVQ